MSPNTAPPSPAASPPAQSPRPSLEAADGELTADALALHRSLLELKRVYQFRDRDRICCHDISVTQCWALEALIRRGPSTLKELAAELYLDKSTTSRVADALQRKGYLERAPHPHDGRALTLRPTDAGADLYRRIETELVEEQRQLLAGFSPDVRSSLIELIARLAGAAERLVDGPACGPAGCGTAAAGRASDEASQAPLRK